MSNPFMTLVDAATALIDDNEKSQGEKAALSVQIPRNGETGQPNGKGSAAVAEKTATPPPGSDDTPEVILVSPPTPRASNRTANKKEPGEEQSPVFPVLPKEKPSFARVLMDVLMDKNLNDTITFLPDGDAFAILKPKKFTEEVMPKYFHIRTFSPFVRKLHRWGFERIMDKRTHDVDVFRHPLFIRGNLTLCDKIKCVGRLVKGPLEEAILSEAGINNRSMAMPTHQELEIRSFFERTDPTHASQQAAKNGATSLLQKAATQNALLELAQQTFAQQEQRRKVVDTQRMLQQQAAESAAVNQLLVASLQQSREEELLRSRLQEELLKQQLSSEMANALQQARLRELLGQARADRGGAPSLPLDRGGAPNLPLGRGTNGGNNLPLSLILREALENKARDGRSLGPLNGYL